MQFNEMKYCSVSQCSLGSLSMGLCSPLVMAGPESLMSLLPTWTIERYRMPSHIFSSAQATTAYKTFLSSAPLTSHRISHQILHLGPSLQGVPGPGPRISKSCRMETMINNFTPLAHWNFPPKVENVWRGETELLRAGPQLWNKLPLKLRTIPNLPTSLHVHGTFLSPDLLSQKQILQNKHGVDVPHSWEPFIRLEMGLLSQGEKLIFIMV